MIFMITFLFYQFICCWSEQQLFFSLSVDHHFFLGCSHWLIFKNKVSELVQCQYIDLCSPDSFPPEQVQTHCNWMLLLDVIALPLTDTAGRGKQCRRISLWITIILIKIYVHRTKRTCITMNKIGPTSALK